MLKFLKRLFLFLLVVGLIGAYFGYDYYKKYFTPNVPNQLSNAYVHIPSNSTFDDVVALLNKQNVLLNESSFRSAAQQMNYAKDEMRSGRFKIKPNMTNYELVQHLRGGSQAPIKLTIHNKRLVEEIAGAVSKLIEPDSITLLNTFLNEELLAEHGYNKETAMAIFIPNTYELYWNTSAENFLKKMLKENKRFWNEERLDKAQRIGLTPTEVYTLASIVNEETRVNSEKPRVAGVYWNRLNKKGWLLEADPTLKFANKAFDLKRVLNRHKLIDSPYNTYKYAGLPPGPIYMSNISSIDATLNLEKHDYMFFCAKIDGSGTHAFAKTLAQHNANARRYWNYLNKRR